jgi:hypothetical protein
MAPTLSAVKQPRSAATLGQKRCCTNTRNIRTRALSRPSALPLLDQSQHGGARESLPLLSRVSACVEVNDLVTTYETFAGRTAMVRCIACP